MLSKTISFALNVASIVLSVISVAGLYYLTKMSFKCTPDETNKKCTGDLTHNQLLLSKVTTVILWLQIALVLGSAIWRMSTK